jgi:multidrug efflux pump subunit AcrA (membrane-fusion protein)
MRRRPTAAAAAVLTVLLLLFILQSVRKASRRHPPAEAIPLEPAPSLLYGTIEPQGKAARVVPRSTGVIRDILVAEGGRVRRGEAVLVLEDGLERASLAAARAREESAAAAAALARDQWERGEALFRGGGIPESERTRLRFGRDLSEAELASRRCDAELAAERLEERVLRSPADGIVYRLDLRRGEGFGPSDAGKVVIGSPALDCVCDAEALWIGRVDTTARYRVVSAETGEALGTARYVSASRTLRPRSARTEDPALRSSADYQEVVFRFTPDRPNLPIGLSVMVLKDDGSGAEAPGAAPPGGGAPRSGPSDADGERGGAG